MQFYWYWMPIIYLELSRGCPERMLCKVCYVPEVDYSRPMQA